MNPFLKSIISFGINSAFGLMTILALYVVKLIPLTKDKTYLVDLAIGKLKDDSIFLFVFVAIAGSVFADAIFVKDKIRGVLFKFSILYFPILVAFALGITYVLFVLDNTEKNIFQMQFWKYVIIGSIIYTILSRWKLYGLK